jgi:hypothetical protein
VLIPMRFGRFQLATMSGSPPVVRGAGASRPQGSPGEPWVAATWRALEDRAPVPQAISAAGGARWLQLAAADQAAMDTGPTTSAASSSTPGTLRPPSGTPPTSMQLPPMPAAAGSFEDMKEKWMQIQYNLSTLPANWVPTRNTIFVLGRPIQANHAMCASVFVWPCMLHCCGYSCLRMQTLLSFGATCSREVISVSHITNDVANFFPGLAYRLRPVPVLQGYSRTATMEPKCKPAHALWAFWKERVGGHAIWGWARVRVGPGGSPLRIALGEGRRKDPRGNPKDVLLPYLLDPRHHPDTVFWSPRTTGVAIPRTTSLRLCGSAWQCVCVCGGGLHSARQKQMAAPVPRWSQTPGAGPGRPPLRGPVPGASMLEWQRRSGRQAHWAASMFPASSWISSPMSTSVRALAAGPFSGWGGTRLNPGSGRRPAMRGNTWSMARS